MLTTIAKDQISGDAYLNLSCPVCGCLPVPHFKNDGYFIDRCPDCGLGYVRNVPSEATRATYGGNAAKSAPVTQSRWSRRIEKFWVAKSIARHAKGRSRLLEIHGCQGRFFNLRYPDEHFDFVVGLHVLDRAHHLAEFLREIRRVLSEHGRAYFVVPRCKYIEPPDRLWRFSVPALHHLFAYHGFRVLFVRRLFGRSQLAVLAEKLY
ncbi:Methyltransferase domain [Burkholderia pseudomallei]|uniref:class I SAM-dependent methyltransferase n=2 Tax=Burkholderia pseudomallei TaxID=28450 RepID=UPI000F19235B|nr:methyltransferase domain-containing protein [Burkholderia pseudomallei]CAJ2717501.1 Methyltransferase domain [Burkholderia pseudomallei]CAJ4481985.1 Methyltransferase domain [Burkholderia pseudomallei]CAJ4658880.1 Methyltransferase domain [Burkholderia pseudomallei]CAJ5803640.1 Methyltransferase domain [Burkholderia pseudomallei]CAJ6385393.1 Methyltransferase domain [Burkholderia pseudomallei]